jgi:hypothetical protein
VTYRNELDQAHQRIEQLEEELVEERAKHAPPVATPAPEPVLRIKPTPDLELDAKPKRSLEWFLWWPVPLTIIALVACFIPIHDEAIPWLVRSACLGSAIMSFEAFLRWRNGGERNVACRLLFVLGCIVGGPAAIAAFFVGGPVLAVGGGIVMVIGAAIALIRWIVKGVAD